MTSPWFFDNDPRQNDFPDEILPDYHPFLGSMFVYSPEQLPQPLPGADPPGSLLAQPPPPVYPPVHDRHHPANFAVAPSSPSVHVPFHHSRPIQTDPRTVPYHASFYYGPMPTVTPTTHQASATLDAGRPLMPFDLQGYPSTVAHGSLPVHDFPQYPPTHGQSRYNSSHIFVSQHEPSHSDMRIPHPQIQPAPASIVESSSSIPSDLAPRLPPTRRNSRRSRPGIRSPYPPTRTPSLPVQLVSPKEMTPHTCMWVKDGIPCGAQITWADLPQHLTTHNIKNIPHDERLSCKWLGCKLRGDKAEMNRENILRHIREKHMGYKRASN